MWSRTSSPQYTKDLPRRERFRDGVLELVISADGLPENIKVTRSLDPGLDLKAIEAVRQWRFAPATKNGEAVAVEANVEVNFKLK